MYAICQLVPYVGHQLSYSWEQEVHEVLECWPQRSKSIKGCSLFWCEVNLCIQSYLINSKSYGQDVLFRSVKNLNYREVCVLFDLDSLHPINNISVIKGRVFLRWTSFKLGLMCLAQGHNAVKPVRFEPPAPGSRVKHSTTELLHSQL